MAQIFISYAREDFQHARELYQGLKAQGFRPWMDKVDLLAGQPWQPVLERAMRESDFFVLLLSRNSVKKRGFVQREIRTALDLWQDKLADDIFLIPIMLEAMAWEEVPEAINKFQWVELFEDDGWERLARALSHGVAQRKLQANLAAVQPVPMLAELPTKAPIVEPVPTRVEQPATPPLVKLTPAPQVGQIVTKLPPQPLPPQPSERKSQQVPQSLPKSLPDKIVDPLSEGASHRAQLTLPQQKLALDKSRPWLRLSLIGVLTIIGLGYWVTHVSSPNSPAPPKASPTPSVSPNAVAQEPSFTETINGVQLEMVPVPGGSFSMGSGAFLKGVNGPHPQVTVPGFFMGKYEVTQAQWQAVMGGGNPSRFKGDLQHPVELVSWEDAKAFCAKLSKLKRKAYRLPSEAEWEYACRAGGLGEKLDLLTDWFSENSQGTTHQVGKGRVNKFGLYDMFGNVWEWCEDVWHDDYQGAPTNGSAWLSGGDHTLRVLRGGSWDISGLHMHGFTRNALHFAARNDSIGLRIVLSARTP